VGISGTPEIAWMMGQGASISDKRQRTGSPGLGRCATEHLSVTVVSFGFGVQVIASPGAQ
jgi:hypothetical protein